jgi:methionyl-tRNA formyltransferase
MEKLRTIFIGTPSFALPSLKALFGDSFFELLAVITQPDRPVGRNQVLVAPPVKEAALDYRIPVLQPEKISEAYDAIASLRPDIIILVAYGQIIPKKILDLPRLGCINVHGSLLPKYRGAAVIQAPIINGDQETGVTIMKMDEGLDTGPIIAQASLMLAVDETAQSLFPKIAELGAKTLLPALKRYAAGGIKLAIQDEKLASYVKMIKKDDARINWTKSAAEIERLTRAMAPWPGAWTKWQDKILKITAVDADFLKINQYQSGQVFLSGNRLVVQCGIDGLVVSRLQLEGKNELSAEEFLRGQKDIIHQILT